jgi:hypothetical protein
MPRRRLAPICLLALLATLLSPVAAIADPATTAKESGGGEVLRRSAATQPSAAEAATAPAGFQDQVVWSGLTLPTAVVFAPADASSSPRRAG